MRFFVACTVSLVLGSVGCGGAKPNMHASADLWWPEGSGSSGKEKVDRAEERCPNPIGATERVRAERDAKRVSAAGTAYLQLLDQINEDQKALSNVEEQIIWLEAQSTDDPRLKLEQEKKLLFLRMQKRALQDSIAHKNAHAQRLNWALHID